MGGQGPSPSSSPESVRRAKLAGENGSASKFQLNAPKTSFVMFTLAAEGAQGGEKGRIEYSSGNWAMAGSLAGPTGNRPPRQVSEPIGR